MSAEKFWILIVLSLMIIGSVGMEIASDAQVAKLNDAISREQFVLSRMSRQQEIFRQMLQRLAVLSVNDPAVADLLHAHGIRVNRVSGHFAVPTSPAATSAGPSVPKPAASAPEVPPVAQ
jgi:hypothetical protein